jgi:hypothetical protein
MIFKQAVPWTHQFLMVQDATGANPHVGGKTGLGAAVTIYLGKNGAAPVLAANSGAVTEIGASMPGVYAVVFSGGADLATAGSLSFYATGAGADPTNEFHRVDTNYLNTDLAINSSGQVNVPSNVKQNTAFTALFFMTLVGTSNPAPGLTVTGQRTFGAAGFSNVSGTIAEVGGAGAGAGWYVLNGVAADSNAPCVGFKMTAIGANDSDFTIWTQP